MYRPRGAQCSLAHAIPPNWKLPSSVAPPSGIFGEVFAWLTEAKEASPGSGATPELLIIRPQEFCERNLLAHRAFLPP